MFCIFFGWRKASKCKKLIKQLQYRLKLLKNKRSSIVKLLREDMAELNQIRDKEKAFNWAEQLFIEESTMAVYELLDNFSELIRSNLSYIRKNKDCPNDINEAVSSLIFASSRCGDLPELTKLRKLFEERYGQSFALAASELLLGNLVNCQVKEKLCIKSVPDDVRLKMMDEIAKDYCRQPEILAIEYTSDLQQVQGNSKHQELDKNVYNCYSRTEECQIETSDANKIQDIHVDSVLTTKTKSTGLDMFLSHQNSDAVSSSISSSIVQQFSPDILESPEHNKAGKARNFAPFDSPFESTVAGDHAKEMHRSGRISTDTKEHRAERVIAASSSESLPQFDEVKVVYLDDIEEFQSSITRDGDCQDQRLFKFKPSFQPKTQTVESFIDQYESWSEKSSSRSSRKSVKASGKQSRRKSLSRENSNIKDVECEIYYDKPRKSSTSKHRSGRKFQSFNNNKNLYDRIKSGCHCHLNCEMQDCSLEYSCYYCIGDDKEERKIPPCKLQTGITKPVKVPIYNLNFCDHFGHCHFSHNRKSEEIERPSLPQKPRRRSCDTVKTEFDVFTYPERWPKEQIEKTEAKAEGFDSTSITPKETEKTPVAPFLTVKSMPTERPKESNTENFMRWNSFPCQNPEHVHPKLPDYDDIAAKFTALKNERLQKKH